MLVATETSDDAGVYRLSDEVALVQTLDFITPPVDDPVVFGKIAAANSLSDVYAMGGVPKTAMNIVCFPEGDLDIGILGDIMEGGAVVLAEAGVVLLGGHSVRDDEPKYGLSVTGVVHPNKIWRNVGAQPGDAVVLTKALGTGLLFNANRRVPLETAEYDALVASTMRLNADAAQVAKRFTVRACTDVTGFGLTGHLCEMAQGVRFEIWWDQLPVLPGVRAAQQRGFSTGSNRKNRAMAGDKVRFDPEMTSYDEELTLDPQTSGGLLLAVPEGEVVDLVLQLRQAGDQAATWIGRVVEVENPAMGGVDYVRRG